MIDRELVDAAGRQRRRESGRTAGGPEDRQVVVPCRIAGGLPAAFCPPARPGCGAPTVAVVAGTRRPKAARAFVRFLLSPETAMQLANGRARQLPLGPVDEARLPAEVRAMMPLLDHAHDLTDLADEAADCLAWLRQRRLR